MSQVETKTQAAAIEAPLAPNNLPAIAQPQQPPARRAKPVGPKEFPARIAKSIIAITEAVGRIQKGGEHDFHKYRYTRWEDINEKLSPLLAEHGLIIVQSEVSRSLLEENDKGSVLAIVYRFTIINDHGDSWPEVEWTAISRLRDQKGITDDRAAVKCHSSAEKHFCIKQFKIRTFEDDKADRHPTLPKKDAKDIYQKMEDEIDAHTTVAALKEWGAENMERKRCLPVDWQDILGERYNEKLADLENQARTAPVVKDTLAEQPATGQVIWDEPDSPYHGETRVTREASPPTRSTAADDPAPPVPSPELAGGAGTLSFEDMAREAAKRGRETFDGFYRSSTGPQRATLRAMKPELEKLMPAAVAQ